MNANRVKKKIVLFLCMSIAWLAVTDSLNQQITLAQSPVRRVNANYFSDDVLFAQQAVFWMGQVTPTTNYANVRVGYNNDKLVVDLAVFDRLIWYDDTSPATTDLENWDAATLYLNLTGNTGTMPTANSYRFVGQVNHWQPRDNYQTSYRGNGADWDSAPIIFSTTSGWRGNINDNIDARGWTITFEIPFSSLGLIGPPATGSTWGMALVMHDRDDLSGAFIPDQTWPETVNLSQPATWGQLGFGLPAYTPPPAVPGGTTTIRQGLNGAVVADAHVGGHTICGAPYHPDYFNGWGDANYAGYIQINIQNQSDVADWPCYSKYYVTFPLNNIPVNKSIISATLVMHQFGNADPSQAYSSLIQVSTVAEDWSESTITWNNAPLAKENIAQSWVDVVSGTIVWPGWKREWDVSRAVAQAYEAGTPLRLALFSADSAYHSGKYFTSSDAEDWDAQGRPTLEILWGEPYLTALPALQAVDFGAVATYSLQVQPIGGSSAGVTLTTGTPPPNLSYQIIPTTVTPPGQATLIVTDSHPKSADSLLANIEITATSSGGAQSKTVQLLVGPKKVYLPMILANN